MEMDKIVNLRQIVDDRCRLNPSNHSFKYAATELSRIESHLQGKQAIDKAFYESLTHGIGLTCARELEQSDPAFCDAVYQMLESIGDRIS